MVTKRSKFSAFLIGFCILACLFTIFPTKSQTDNYGYKPERDVNSDGLIDIFDIAAVALGFGSNGTAYNYAEWIQLVEDRVEVLEANVTSLSERIDNINATNLMPFIQNLTDEVALLKTNITNIISSMSQLDGRIGTAEQSLLDLIIGVGTLQDQMVTMDSRITQLEGNITRLDAADLALSQRMSDLEAQIALLNASNLLLQLQIDALNTQITNLWNNVTYLNSWVASYNATCAPVLMNMTSSITVRATTEQLSWVDIEYTSVTINVNRTSNLLVVFSADAWVSDSNGQLRVRAWNGTTAAKPGDVILTPSLSWTSGNTHLIGTMAYTYVFYFASVPAGTQTIKMQFRVVNSITGSVGNRTLTVLAFPSP